MARVYALLCGTLNGNYFNSRASKRGYVERDIRINCGTEIANAAGNM